MEGSGPCLGGTAIFRRDLPDGLRATLIPHAAEVIMFTAPSTRKPTRKGLAVAALVVGGAAAIAAPRVADAHFILEDPSGVARAGLARPPSEDGPMRRRVRRHRCRDADRHRDHPAGGAEDHCDHSRGHLSSRPLPDFPRKEPQRAPCRAVRDRRRDALRQRPDRDPAWSSPCSPTGSSRTRRRSRHLSRSRSPSRPVSRAPTARCRSSSSWATTR